ncbi:hypothetical protein S7711_03952 [Stachybotrys chartarum IBT 7711]|uniref:Uncharacterized protein n=1 Tax=Stachybotrys chartarum (strain CBS 109288 / IBT 7711) TaxID=1280523 RepID=A0A084AQX1_STACB|nr:hypothetical protein S7711_03952 [Stachybotrys chartarum IBT 7711]KFA54822.1 hypothetical protein S40293_10422 [Stachybotrys chartarum IBT 40293]KFA75691.1 hypothetical protein S40288_11119 [Stachybotrys chartarum IBT 40288]
MLALSKVPFLVHAVIESLAASSFILRPQSQLSPLSPPARLILQSKGGLLLFSNLVCLVFLRRPFDETSSLVALSLAFWHLWPCHRALVRIRTGMDKEFAQETAFGGPVVHLGIHVALFCMFVATGVLSEEL